MQIDDAINNQIRIIKIETDKLLEANASDDKQLMNQSFTLASLHSNLRQMVYERSEGKTTW